MAVTGTQIQRYDPERIPAEGGESDRSRSPQRYGCTRFNGCRERSIHFAGHYSIGTYAPKRSGRGNS